jgi:hypothetical protein
MPFYLEEIDFASELSGCRSVLIVPCRFCPAASAAVRNNEPYVEFFRKLLKTDSYERQIDSMRSHLEKEGIKANVFRSTVLHQFILCMWTVGRHQKLLKEATQHDAAVVIGCDAAFEVVSETLKSTDCRVIHGMKTEGIMTVIPEFRFPGNIMLRRGGITRVLH